MIRPPRPEALSIRCPWCGAAAGNWCEKVFTRRQGKAPVSFFVHPSRADAVNAKPAPLRVPWASPDANPQF